jgi:hypothetical protein
LPYLCDYLEHAGLVDKIGALAGLTLVIALGRIGRPGIGPLTEVRI